MGFVLAVYSGLGLLPLGVIALLVAIIYVQVTSGNEKAAQAQIADDDDEEEF